jgi:hypothetical protein
VPSQARYYRGQIHAFHAFLFRAIAKQCWEDIFAFLARQLGAASPPGAPSYTGAEHEPDAP